MWGYVNRNKRGIYSKYGNTQYFKGLGYKPPTPPPEPPEPTFPETFPVLDAGLVGAGAFIVSDYDLEIFGGGESLNEAHGGGTTRHFIINLNTAVETDKEPLPRASVLHGVTQIPEGAFIMGGASVYADGGNYYNTSLFYNKASGVYEEKIGYGNPTERMGIVAIGEGVMSICGVTHPSNSWRGNTLTNNLYVDYKSNTKGLKAGYPISCCEVSAVSKDNNYYSFGGNSSSTSYTPFERVYKFNYSSNNFETLPNYPLSTSLTLTILIDNIIYVIGGVETNKLYKYDINTKSYEELENLPTDINNAVGGYLINNTIGIVGGKTTYDAGEKGSNKVIYYDIENNKYITKEE